MLDALAPLGVTHIDMPATPGARLASDQEQQAWITNRRPRIAAEDYLDALAAHGIEHLFCNPGTDFAPIVEAFARAARTNRKVPRPMVVPHENAAVGMAHGYTMVTGRPQAVMLHTNVGTANAINMLIDASRDRMPMLLTSGRTPFTESGAARLAQRAYPLGAGDVRPGGHAARNGQVGLRDEARRPGCARWWIARWKSR